MSAKVTPLDPVSLAFRRQILEAVARARRGHIASAFSIVEILRVLYEEVLRVDPSRPEWEERDRFILSKGHGCLALYVALARRGFFPSGELARFCAFGGILGGHPERGKVPGVEASTGSLGHGLPIAVGFSLHARLAAKGFRTFVLIGDGECDEGSVWESALAAAKHRLASLTVLVDANGMQSWGPTAEVLDLEPLADKWRSFGFEVGEVDGHDMKALREALGAAHPEAGSPRAVICRTVKGKGIPCMEGDASWHHKSRVSDEEMQRLKDELGCSR